MTFKSPPSHHYYVSNWALWFHSCPQQYLLHTPPELPPFKMWCISYHPPKPTSGCLVIKSKLCPAVYNLYMLQLLPSHKEPESNPTMYTEGSNSHSFHTSHHIICLHDTCLLMKCKEWTLLHKTDIHPQTKAPLWELQDLGGPPTCIPSNRQTDFSV